MDQPVLVEKRAGAGGTKVVAADGYTIMLVSTLIVIAASTFENYADFLPAMPLMDFSLGRTCATYSGTQRLRSRRTSESSGIRS